MRILIADDERMICEWLQFGIENRPGCELCGCAHNGEQALELFNHTKPDVVFSDIKMPLMDGVELLRRIKLLSPETIVVLLTAFSEFDLAREALRNGAYDYLLKTEMNNQSFQKVLERIEGQLKQSKEIVHEMGEEMEKSSQSHSIVRNILKDGKKLTEADLQLLKDCRIKWRDNGLFAIAIWKRELLKGFQFPKHPCVHHVTGFEYDELVYVAVGNLDRNLSQLQKTQTLYGYASGVVSENHCMVGISFISEQLTQIGDLVIEAVHALSKGYYEPQIKVLEPSLNGRKLREKREQWESFLKKERQGLYDAEGLVYNKKVEMVLDWALENRISVLENLIHFCGDAMEMAFVRYASEDAPLMAHMLAEEKKRTEQVLSYKEMRELVLELIQESIFRQELDIRKMSKGVAFAVTFIRKHYNEPISLEQVALEVHLNTEYLSRIFKEEVGCNYTAFLSETRLKRAAYLLSHTAEKVQSIADQVGYPNVSYFSTTFKKRYGVNPYEYRREEGN